MEETGRNAPRLWRLRAEWIPAYAGTMVLGARRAATGRKAGG